MSGHFLLDWAALTVSLGNAVLLLWLGATVLLTADRRTWGIGLAGSALLLGGAFFFSHAALLDLGRANLARNLRAWWYLSLFPAVVLPLAWYVVILWYSGYWTGPEATSLRRRQRRWLPGILLLAGLLAGVAYANPLPQTFSLMPMRLLIAGVGGTPLLVGGYALYVLGCIGLSLDALVRPGPTARVMGDLARQPDLLLESLQPDGIDPAWRKEFQGHRIPEPEIVRPIHLAHGASSQRRHQTVAVSDDGSGRKSLAGGRGDRLLVGRLVSQEIFYIAAQRLISGASFRQEFIPLFAVGKGNGPEENLLRPLIPFPFFHNVTSGFQPDVT